VSLPSPKARIVLVGCDCSPFTNIALMTHEAVQSYERTEAFEWAKRRGNPNAAIPALQPFKLKYAKLLADFGWEVRAKMYLDSIRLCTGLKASTNGVSKTDTVYSNDFIEDLNICEDRVCESLGIALSRQTSENEKKTHDRVSSALKSVSSVLTEPRKSDSAKDQSNKEKPIFSAREAIQESSSRNSALDAPPVSNANFFHPVEASDVAAPIGRGPFDVDGNEHFAKPAKDLNKTGTKDNGFSGAPLREESEDGLEGPSLVAPSFPAISLDDNLSALSLKPSDQKSGIQSAPPSFGNSKKSIPSAPRSSGPENLIPPKEKYSTIKPPPKSEGARLDSKPGTPSGMNSKYNNNVQKRCSHILACVTQLYFAARMPS